MKKPFQSFNYDIRVLTPVHIGAAKENEYVRGQDYFYDSYYYFINKSLFYKSLSAQSVAEYSNALIGNNVKRAEEILIKTVDEANTDIISIENNEPVGLLNPTVEIADTIKKHICDGFGHLMIPGSTLKGALRSMIANFLIKGNPDKYIGDRDDRNLINDCFGGINGNMMRFLQVGDVSFDQKFGQLAAYKIFSGDTLRTDTEGKWKNNRVGGHDEAFNTKGFVSYAETIAAGSSSKLRINWGDETLKIAAKKQVNTPVLNQFFGHGWMEIARKQMNDYLDQEIHFFETFKNDDFDDAVELLERLKDKNQQENSVVMRIGAGSGYHAITGNWKFNDHTRTGDNPRTPGQIDKKTRKVTFDKKLSKQFPGFIEVTAQGK